MLDAQKTAYELDYWRQTPRAKNEQRAKAILKLWGFTGADSVLEVGTGPYGGCLPFINARLRFGSDPLIGDYLRAGLLDARDWDLIPEAIEKVKTDTRFDAVLCMNTLDHGDSDFTAIDAIARLLKPAGRFYLHVNLRTPEQLNEGHDHALQIDDLNAAIQRNGLRTLRRSVYNYDPVEYAPYCTVVGVWEKPA